jgi:hypothetical protein
MATKKTRKAGKRGKKLGRKFLPAVKPLTTSRRGSAVRARSREGPLPDPNEIC